MYPIDRRKLKLNKDFIISNGKQIIVEKDINLQYTIVEPTRIKNIHEFYNIVNFPLQSILFVPVGDPLIGFTIKTRFQDHVEATFKIGSDGVFLTKGPLGEIYQNNVKKIGALYENHNQILEPGTILIPKQENRTVVKVDEQLYTKMESSELFKATGFEGLVIRPSYDISSIMRVSKDDYIVVHDKHFYRVYGPAFNKTYKIKTNSQSVGSNKVRVLGRERNVTKVGRKQMVTYTGKQICLTDARKLEKQLARYKK